MRVWNSRGELSGWRGREWRMHSFDDINSIQFRANVGRQRSSSSFFSTTTADSEQVSLDALLSTLTLLLVSSIPEPCQRSTFSSMIPVLFTFTSLMVSLMDSSQRIDFDWSPFPLRLSPSKPTDKETRLVTDGCSISRKMVSIVRAERTAKAIRPILHRFRVLQSHYNFSVRRHVLLRATIT